ncbi:hypothetical protein ACN082_02145 [Rothia sp. CCM 9417]|uniref:hypothetical protein n=1 Tax=unclassified Rothia (in: high G+C Gram-positive bacteria) TaxID=2689056 RepID=UPI003AC4812C
MNFFKYSLLRLSLAALAFFAAYYIGAGLYLSAICGVIIGFAICYLAFPRLHVAAAGDFNRLLKRKPREKTTIAEEDQAVEDQIDEANRSHQSL